MIIFILLFLVVSLIANIFLLICLKKLFDRNDTLEFWIIDFQNLMEETYIKLKKIDERNIFEKDDDVGFLFSDILNIIKKTNERIQTNDKSNEFNEKNKEENFKKS